MTYDDIKTMKIPNGNDVKIYDIITDTGNRYKVASKTVLGANRKISRFEGKQVRILSINTIEEGLL